MKVRNKLNSYLAHDLERPFPELRSRTYGLLACLAGVVFGVRWEGASCVFGTENYLAWESPAPL